MTREEMDELLACEVWPCCWVAVNVLEAMRTQWRTAAGGGLVGLDYTALPFVLEMTAVPRTEWSQVFSDLHVLEHAALSILNEVPDG